MRKKKWLKSITAVAMSIVLLVTTVPIVLAVTATPQKYNPSPIFSDASREQGAASWLSEDGRVFVEFPSAQGGLTYEGYKQKEADRLTLGDEAVEQRTYPTKDIVAYVLELYDLGAKLTAHDITAKEPLTVTVDAAGAPVSYAGSAIRAQFSKAAVDGWGGVDLTNRRYSVTITAVDSDGWLSQEMYTYVSDVPIFSLTDEEMMPMSAHEHAMREMMCFEEKKTEDTQSDDGTVRHDTNVSDTKNIRVDYEEEGGTVSIKGKAEQAGAINAATDITTDTSAYRILITGKPGANGQTVDIGWSRQTYDYTGAKEIWFWLDLSQVDMKGISFRLRPNEKQWRDYGGGDDRNAVLDTYEADDYGTVYSTVGAKDKNPYVYVQQEDGSWKTVNMTNGKIDLAHFKGYVRVPIQFFCSETATYVQLTNDEMGKHPRLLNGSTTDQNKVKEWANQFYLKNADGTIANVEVDKAGTPISEAVLLQRRGSFFHKDTKWIGAGWFNVSWMKNGLQESENKNTDAYMIAPGRGIDDINDKDYASTCADVEKQADGTYAVVRRENAYKAIQDVMAAGFAYTGISDDSVDKSVYLDNVMFYRDDNGEFPPNTLGSNTSSTGVPVSNYFNQKEAIQEAIFNIIDEYIVNPNYSDYRAVKYIANLINNYKRVYQEAGQYNATGGFLDYEKSRNSADYGKGPLADAAAKLGKAATWQKYLDARKACLDEGTIKLVDDGRGGITVKNTNNSAVNDLVPDMIRAMEKLPDPESVTQVSGTLRTEIVKLYRIYTKLNLGQLALLGQEEEDRLIKYFDLVVNAIGGGFITGRELANMPFITFNNFEENTNIGDRGYQLENDPNIGGDTDFRNTKGIVTYSIDNGENFTKIANGFNHNPSPEKRANASWAYVTNQGFKNSKGATVTVDADWTGGTETGTWHTITVAKKSTPAANLAGRKAINMSAENLGGMAAENKDKLVGMDAGVMPLSLVFYVDFTNLSNFKFGVNVFSVNGAGDLVKCRPDMGDNNASPENKKLWRAYYMMDPVTGEWVRVQNDNQWSFSSNSTDGVGASLDGYKGYIAIPLQHFKRKNADISDLSGKTYQLDYDTAVLNNIFAVQFGIAGDASIDNATYTIDNIGFTYDKKTYEDRGLTTGQEVTTYAEKFGAKSDTAEKFEEAVANIDPYADNTALADAITKAEDIYYGRGEYLNKGLADYQKTLTSVIQAKALLDKYKANDIPAADMTVDQLITEIGTISSTAKAVDTSASDLPQPGFGADGNVNYATFGLADKAEAEKIVKLYENTYKRISNADKSRIADEAKQGLINAYGAARRCLSLEDMKASANSFLAGLSGSTGIYNETTKDGIKTTYTSIGTRDADATKWDEIYNRNMPYFAKAILASGGMNGDSNLKKAQYANLGIPRFLRNCRTEAINLGVALSDGTTSTQGGIIQLQEKYTKIYNDTKAKIEAKQVFTADELKTITDAIGEYDSLMQAYHDVVELYNVIEDIKALFPVHNVSVDKETVSYTKDNYNTAQTVTYSLDYTETYPVPASESEYNMIRVTFTNGVLTNALNEEEQYKVEFALNGKTCSYTSAYLKENPVHILPNIKCANNIKQDLQITLVIENPDGAAPTAANEVTESLKIELLDKDGNVLQSRSGAADASTGWNALEDVGAKTVTFSYVPDDAYSITIPAEVNVPWNSADAQKVGYKVETSLATGSSIAVSVADDGTNQLKADGYSYTLPFTPENFAAKTFTGTTSKNMATEADCPKLTISGWESVPIGEYHTNLTYTVDYTKGTATP